MEYRQETTIGYSDKVKASFVGMLLGFAMITAATALLWWNEGNFVGTRDALNEAQAVTVELEDIHRLDAAKNGKIVHATGTVETDEIIEDPFFNVSTNAIRLERVVEYLQWVEEAREETRRKSGGGEERVTTYTYKQEWVKSPVNSSRFAYPGAPYKYKNTVVADIQGYTAQATDVTLGAYLLPKFLVDSITGAEPFYIELSEEAMEKVNGRIVPAAQPSTPEIAQSSPGADSPFRKTGDETGREPTDDAPPAPKPPRMVHLSGNTLYLGLSPQSPRIGDIRANFARTKPDTVSIIAKVNGDTFERFLASNGNTVGKLVMGAHSQENMYKTAHSGNVGMTWIFRIVGIGLAYFGMKRLFEPLAALAGIVPLLGDIVGVGAKLASALLGTAWSLLVIAVAWVRFRPLTGFAILAIAVVLVALVYFMGRRSATGAATAN